MKKNIVRISILVFIASLVSLSFDEESYFLQLDKKIFKKDEIITGKAYINTDAMKAITNKKDQGYCAFDDEYNLLANAIQVRIAPPAKDKYSWNGYVTIQNAITVKNDTAFLSFKVPQSLIKGDNTQTLQIKVSRQWTMRGRDTTFVITKQFQISK
jgi:hypothetical protein